MLQLQRASAGSGKTYLLAKKYIQYFISARNPDGSLRLRSKRELRDSLKHILAITFTNKATNEMKLRIVDKLDALGNWTPEIPTSAVDYLDDFCKELNSDPGRIADIAKVALHALLSEYGDFKVSTIDSFFQTVLRTFAYEAELDDTYAVELDSSYVAQIGLDTTLDEIEADPDKAQGLKWIEGQMSNTFEGDKRWNVFQRQDNGKSLYSKILKESKNLDKENFKAIREDLDAFFEKVPDFYAYYEKLRDFYESDVRAAHKKMRKAALKVEKAFLNIGLDIKTMGGQYLHSRVRNLAHDRGLYPKKNDNISYKPPVFTRKTVSTRVFDPRQDNPYLGTPTEDEIERLAIEMFEAFKEWAAIVSKEALTRWRLYDRMIPTLGLLQNIRKNSKLYLADSNTIELSETNSILNRIIGEDDAPFVYERLGNRLEHFLIDEFQDTSALQWENLRPLLTESESKGFDNLIIGDPKQSIYRFRNADPSLITHKVPQQFRNSVFLCGNSPKENTNWRSARKIVEFNNYFFRFLTRSISPEMESLYSNIIQPPHHRDDTGYVRVQLCSSKDKNDYSDLDAEEENKIPPHFREIPMLISDMLDRGYAMKDIAILVDRNKTGSQLIQCIMAHNMTPGVRNVIEFMSAESLKIGESVAVQTIIAVLESINKGTKERILQGAESRKIGVGDWNRLQADFSFFALQHPDIPLPEQLRLFISGDHHPDAVRDMLRHMSTTVLPALVENIIHNFIPHNLRKAEAPFIATFMDCVLDFCESKTSDLASFLIWWDKLGSSRSIPSAEETDAVQIMTIHKSKGLEFRCVIIPISKISLQPNSHEQDWLWVEPDFHEVEDLPRIPYLPVIANSSLENTQHGELYGEFLKVYIADKINASYVAYTRAVDELYVFASITRSKKGDTFTGGKGSMGLNLWKAACEAGDNISELEKAYPEIGQFLPDPTGFSIDEESLRWELGEQPSREEVLATSEARSKGKRASTAKPMEEYGSGADLPDMLYRDPASPDESPIEETDPSQSPEASEYAEDDHSRVQGELLHSLMEQIQTPDDIARAIRRFHIKGHVGSREAAALESDIRDAISSVEQYGWFSPGVKTLRERAISDRGRILRPDRVVLNPDGTATVVDFKFGANRRDEAYGRQVGRYADALVRAGLAKKCEAYIWYVSLGIVVSV